MASLACTGLIADDLYLLAHDDLSGKPFLQPRALGIGLAAGLLAELAVEEAIRIQDDQVIPAGLAPDADNLARCVLRLLYHERQPLPARTWLAFLAASSGEQVAHRLERAGYLMRTASRWPWQPARWMPADADCAFAPLIRVCAVLDEGRPVTVPGALLAGLAAASGLEPRILPYGPPDARGRLDRAVRQLSPDLRELIAQTRSAVDTTVLSHRR